MATDRSRLWAVLTAVPAILLMFGLGTWQVQRLAEKAAMISARESASLAAPVPLDSVAALNPDRFYRRVRMTGSFLGKDMRLGPRFLHGRPGQHLLVPFRLHGGDTVLVDRGWIPDDPKSRFEAPRGETTIEGLLRLPAPKNWATPANAPDTNRWYFVDAPAMAAAAGLAGLPEAYVEIAYVGAAPAATAVPGPVPSPVIVDLPNNHLQYAVTWYALAVVMAVIFGLYWRGTVRKAAQ